MPNTYTAEEREKVRGAIRRKYESVSTSAAGLFKYVTGREGAELHGYDRELVKQVPVEMLKSFCGVGNPFSLGDIEAGSDILDIGCGSGFDLIVARRLSGEGGRVCGIDITPEMIEQARRNFAELGIDDIETLHVTSETLPFEDEGFDLLISNGVINLSPAKDELFEEMYRVLRRGGRLQIADMVLQKDLPPDMAGSLESWSQ